jgi:uncharacterized protein (TIGR02646 family)
MIHIERSKEAPLALTASKARDRYRHDEVVDRLRADSYGKCYICEIGPVQDPEVEHRLPHKGGRYPERMYDWHNLFYSCGHCNKVKNKQKYDSGIIDCCARDPELLLEQELTGDDVTVRVLNEDDEEARLTAQLIEEVFTSESKPLRTHASDVRLKELQRQMNLLYSSLSEYETNRDDFVARRTVRTMLRSEAPFAGFARCYVRKHLDVYPEFEVYLPRASCND